MAVYFYDVGDHPAGFVGFRVITTLGKATDLRQAYFSLNDYSYSTAERLAYDLNEKLRAQAGENARNNRIKQPKVNAGAGGIIHGLRAGIKTESRNKGEYFRFYPYFEVGLPGHGMGSKRFRIDKLGYRDAYRKAVESYAKVYDLTSAEMASVYKLMPSKDVFTGPLRQRLVERGYEVSAEHILEILNSQPDQYLSPSYRPE